MATARQARLPLQLGHANFAADTAASTAPLPSFGGEFGCWHAFLASRRIDCQAADFAVGTGLKCDSKRKLGGKEIAPTFWTDPEFRKTPIGGRFDCQKILLARDNRDSFAFRFVSFWPFTSVVRDDNS
jgi:hypothetical protein